MNLFRETLKGLIRYALGVLFGWLIMPLVAKGVLGADLGDQIRSSIDSWAGLIALAIITLVGPVLWTWWDKVVAKVKVLVAAQLRPSVATEGAIEAQTSALSKEEKLRTATSPGTSPVPR